MFITLAVYLLLIDLTLLHEDQFTSASNLFRFRVFYTRSGHPVDLILPSSKSWSAILLYFLPYAGDWKSLSGMNDIFVQEYVDRVQLLSA